MHKLTILVAFAIATAGLGSPAFAGEVTGNYDRTGAPSHSNSICSYSGLEDGTTIVGVDPDTGELIFGPWPTGHGVVQTPHADGPHLHNPGEPGQNCQGGSNPENPPQ